MGGTKEVSRSSLARDVVDGEGVALGDELGGGRLELTRVGVVMAGRGMVAHFVGVAICAGDGELAGVEGREEEASERSRSLEVLEEGDDERARDISGAVTTEREVVACALRGKEKGEVMAKMTFRDSVRKEEEQRMAQLGPTRSHSTDTIDVQESRTRNEKR